MKIKLILILRSEWNLTVCLLGFISAHFILQVLNISRLESNPETSSWSHNPGDYRARALEGRDERISFPKDRGFLTFAQEFSKVDLS